MKRFKVIFSIFVLAVLIALGLWNNKVQSAANQKAGAAITAFPVSVAPVVKEKLDQAISLTGTITGNNDVAIVSETQGRVVGVYAQVGNSLGAGATIVQIDDELKKANYSLADANYQKTKKDLDRNEELFKNNSISTSQIEASRLAFQQAEAQFITARRQYNDTRITTPIAGVVTARNVDVGVMVMPGTVVANVVDISRLKVKINVAEHDVFQLKSGDKATVTTNVYPGVTFEAKIEHVSAKGDEAHTYPVELSLVNSAKNPLKAGMFARVEFSSAGSAVTLVIPREAVITSLKKPQVYVIQNDKAHLRDIVTGTATSTKIEVLSGLNEGDIVVVNGQNTLSDETPVTIVKN